MTVADSNRHKGATFYMYLNKDLLNKLQLFLGLLCILKKKVKLYILVETSSAHAFKWKSKLMT